MISTLLFSLALATGPSLSVHVDGDGYMRFVKDGRIVYATSANLTVDSGLLGSKGLPLTPPVRVTANTTSIAIDLSGNITAFNTGGKSLCGQIVLARFTSKPVEEQGFLISTTRASLGNPGEIPFGVIRSANAVQSTNSGQTSISIPKLTEVESDSMTLADIARIEGDAQTKAALGAISLGTSPRVGIDMPVTQGRILSLIKRAGIDPHVDLQIAPDAVIRRKFQAIPEEDFVAAATKAVQTTLGAVVPLTCADQLGDFKAPLGKLELKVANTTASGQSMIVTVDVIVDGKPVNSRIVTLKADVSAQIKPGTFVKILMKSAGITVEVAGQARTGGMVGQPITVVVTETGSILSGIVLSSNSVEVKI